MSIEKISDSDNLWRRILNAPPDFVIKPDGTPSSSNFQLKRNETGLSVNIERLSVLNDFNPKPTEFVVYSLLSDPVRTIGLECIHVPQKDNFGHAEIRGIFSRKISRKLARMAARVN